MNDKNKCKDCGQTLTAYDEHERFSLFMGIINNPDSSEIKKLFDPCIESQHKKIVRHKKMTTTARNLQEIHANLLGAHKPLLLLGKTYNGLLFNEFIQKSWCKSRSTSKLLAELL